MEQLSQEHLGEIRKLFDTFDKNGDGKIDGMEIKGMMQILLGGKHRETINYDDLHGGTIDFHEFCELVARDMGEGHSPEDEMLEAFQVFDKNHDGLVTMEEIKQVMRGIGEKVSEDDIRDLIKRGDLDGDGKLNYKEFVRVMCHKK